MIELKNIHKDFGGMPVLKGVSCKIVQGETVSIVGPSGAGKSVLLRCMNFLEVPNEGMVRINGIKLSPRNALRMRHQIGMVFQQFNLFNHMTVLENITYTPIVLGEDRTVVHERALGLLRQVGLEDKVGRYPHALSGGQKQRVAIVRALAMKPSVMLLDEPTSALDPEMVKEVLEVIQSLSHHGMTVVLVTHEMAFAKRVSDRILFMADGMLLEDTHPEKFFGTPRTQRARDFLAKVL